MQSAANCGSRKHPRVEDNIDDSQKKNRQLDVRYVNKWVIINGRAQLHIRIHPRTPTNSNNRAFDEAVRDLEGEEEDENNPL